MHGIPVSVTFGKRRGWIEGLPGLDWACVVITAFVVVAVHFVLASKAREAKRHVIFMVGLGSDWGRIGLDWVLFSLVFLSFSCENAVSWVVCYCHGRIGVGLGSDWVGLGVVFLSFSYENAVAWVAHHLNTACNVTG